MKIELQIARLKKQYRTLYNRTYAITVRRSEMQKQREQQLRRWIKATENFSSIQLRQLGCILSGLRRGKKIMMLTQREHSLLKYKLLAKRIVKS